MILTQCSGGGTCYCPSWSSDCFVVWPWIIFLLFTLASLAIFVAFIRSLFFKSRTGLSPTARLQKQNQFWRTAFFVIVGQIIATAIIYPKKGYWNFAIELAVLAIAYIIWRLSRNKANDKNSGGTDISTGV